MQTQRTPHPFLTAVRSLRRAVLLAVLGVGALTATAQTPSGYWNFDLANREQLISGSGTLTKNGTGSTTTGPNGATDGAVQFSGNGGWYRCNHGMPANGGTSSYVRQYTLMWDLKYPNSGTWKCLLQTNGDNANDSDLFIKNSGTAGTIGGASGLGGYSSNATAANTWYRIVMTCDTTLGSGDVKIYVNGSLWYTSTKSISSDGAYALDLDDFLISRDNDGEHDTMVLSAFATWNSTLSAAQVATLGTTANVLVKNSQTVTFTNPGTKTYGDAAFGLSASASSGLGVTFSVVSGPATVDGSTLTLTGAGTVTARASQGGDANWNAVASADQSFTVSPKSVTVTATAKAKTYGDADPALTYAADGLVGEDVLSGALTRALGENAGAYAIGQGTLTAGANYALAFTAADLTIGKATLICRAADATRVRGQPNPAFAITYTGFVFGEDAAVLDEAPTTSTAATAASPAGAYPITVQGGQDDNYEFSSEQGTLQVFGRGTLIRVD